MADVKISELPAGTDSSNITLPANQGSVTGTTSRYTTGQPNGLPYLDGSGQIGPTSAMSLYATLASPTFTGVPAAPTAIAGTSTTQLATTEFVQNAISAFGLGNPASVAYWQTSSQLGSNIFFTYGGAGDATGAFLGIGVSTPLEKLHVVGNQILTGQAAIGNSAQAGLVSGIQRFVDISQTITDFTPTDSWRLNSVRLVIDPSATSTTDSATAFFSQVSIPNTNSNDFGNLISNTALSQHGGSGTVNQNIARNTTATLIGAGDIVTNAADSITFQATNTSAGTITNNFGQVFNSGSQSASSSITNNFSQLFRSPRIVGPITNHRAIYAEDQSGAANSYFIYSEGGQSYHAGFLGLGTITPTVQLDVATEARIFGGGGIGGTLTLDGSNTWKLTSGAGGDTVNGGFEIRDYGDGTVPFVITPSANYVGIQNTAPPALLSLSNNIFLGTTYTGSGAWTGTGTAIELLHSGVRSSWQSTSGEAGTIVKFGSETSHGLRFFTNNTTAITIDTAQRAEFSAAATFDDDVTVSGRLLGALGSVTNANDVTLPTAVGNVFSIGGSAAAVNTLDLTGWTAGSVVILLCTSGFVFHHNTAGAGGSLLLAGSVDFTVVANCVLTLLCDGTNWQEVARKSP